MAKKPQTYYLCRNCGAMSPKWMGKCPECNAWDSLEEMTKATDDPHKPKSLAASSTPSIVNTQDSVPIALADVPPLLIPRISTQIPEFDRVLGGGIVPGSAILLGGEPGIGKSTLLLQTLAELASSQNGGAAPSTSPGGTSGGVLYVTSEESAQQTQLRARRLGHGASSMKVYAETNLEKIASHIGRQRPALVVIDSVQMIYKPDNPSAPGSVSQLRDCCTELVYLAKATGTAIILVGHVTKEGILAGPKLIEHIVDTVLYFEGDSHHDHRIVRCAKNRFGNTLEIGLFRMTGAGLEGVENAATLLLEADHAAESRLPGSAITAALQGSRVLMVEVQALTTDAMLGSAKRKVTGCDSSRVAMIIAILEKRGGLRLVDKDVFVNIVGGIKISDPSADAAIALAIASAHMNRPLPPSTLVLGELGLLGEIRSVSQLGQRVLEADRLGFKSAILPASKSRLDPKLSLQLHLCKRLGQAIDLLQ